MLSTTLSRTRNTRPDKLLIGGGRDRMKLAPRLQSTEGGCHTNTVEGRTTWRLGGNHNATKEIPCVVGAWSYTTAREPTTNWRLFWRRYHPTLTAQASPETGIKVLLDDDGLVKLTNTRAMISPCHPCRNRSRHDRAGEGTLGRSRGVEPRDFHSGAIAQCQVPCLLPSIPHCQVYLNGAIGVCVNPCVSHVQSGRGRRCTGGTMGLSIIGGDGRL